MNERAALALPAAVGDPFEGGFYAGLINIAGCPPHVLIVAPKDAGEISGAAWNGGNAIVTGALSFFDGAANTRAMAAAGSELAKAALALEIAGFTDWHLPSRDELEILYRAFKPTDEENWCYSGDNPSSIPVAYAYRLESPGRTPLELFRAGGDQAFANDWYWSSTQYAGDESSAWAQLFGNGCQSYYRKGNDLPARAVRRLPI